MRGVDDDSAFAPGVSAWRRNLGTVGHAVRQELVARQLAEHLPPAGTARLRILDAGCGQGTQAVRLARLGHRVVGVDASQTLLDDARRNAADESADVLARLSFEHGDVLGLDQRLVGRFDLVCCHGVVMYLPRLQEAVAAVVTAARPGGLVSVLTRNRASLAMRAGMSGDWRAAVDLFDAHRYTNRLGLDDVRADEPLDVRRALADAGAETLAWYGVRLFSDHWQSDVPSPADLAGLIDAEDQAGRRDPYRAVAAMTHTVARRRRHG